MSKIHTDPNYVALKRYGYSLERIKKRYPQGCPTHVIAQGLEITEAEVDTLFNQTVEKLKKLVEED